MPICLPIPKLASAPESALKRFKNGLLAPNLGRTQHASYLRDLYNHIASEWGEDAEQGETLYASTEPKLRELILGVDNSRATKFASYDFGTASLFAASNDYSMANLYFSYALTKLAGELNKPKLGYGYDVSGEVQGGGGTSGDGRHLWDTGNSPKRDRTPSNPANMLYDAEAESDYPELVEFKHKRVHWPPRTR